MCVWMVSVNVPEPEWPLRGQVAQHPAVLTTVCMCIWGVGTCEWEGAEGVREHVQGACL